MNKPITFLLAVAAIAASAFGQVPVSVHSKKEMEKNWQKKCLISGTYKTMMLPESEKDGSPLKSSNRIVILLSDSTELALETHDKGLRDSKEKAKFSGHQVLISGTLIHHAQLWGKPEEAAILMDAIVEIESIDLKKTKPLFKNSLQNTDWDIDHILGLDTNQENYKLSKNKNRGRYAGNIIWFNDSSKFDCEYVSWSETENDAFPTVTGTYSFINTDKIEINVRKVSYGPKKEPTEYRKPQKMVFSISRAGGTLLLTKE